MSKSVTFTVDADVYEKFCIALNLTNATKDAAVESCMRWYISGKVLDSLLHRNDNRSLIHVAKIVIRMDEQNNWITNDRKSFYEINQLS